LNFKLTCKSRISLPTCSCLLPPAACFINSFRVCFSFFLRSFPPWDDFSPGALRRYSRPIASSCRNDAFLTLAVVGSKQMTTESLHHGVFSPTRPLFRALCCVFFPVSDAEQLGRLRASFFLPASLVRQLLDTRHRMDFKRGPPVTNPVSFILFRHPISGFLAPFLVRIFVDDAFSGGQSAISFAVPIFPSYPASGRFLIGVRGVPLAGASLADPFLSRLFPPPLVSFSACSRLLAPQTLCVSDASSSVTPCRSSWPSLVISGD